MIDLELEIGGEVFLLKARDAGDKNTLLLLDAAQDIADKIVDVAQGLAPKVTGELATKGIGAHVDHVRPGNVEVHAGLKKIPLHGKWVHEGTGLYGAFHRPIVPTKGNVMAFGGNITKTFARVVKGQKPQPFMTEATLLVENMYIPVRIRELGIEISTLK